MYNNQQSPARFQTAFNAARKIRVVYVALDISSFSLVTTVSVPVSFMDGCQTNYIFTRY